jgi:threonine dehydrogenase-like Zn-dependent dehydrogenase
MHGLGLAHVRSGQRVGVVGAGSIGLLTVAAARSLGAEVVLIARYAHQAAAGEAFGATLNGNECDVVVDTGGTTESIREASMLARPGALLVLLAGNADIVPFVELARTVPELTLIRSAAYNSEHGYRDVEAAARLLADTPGIAQRLITHRFPLGQATVAFQMAAQRRAGVIKVVLEP